MRVERATGAGTQVSPADGQLPRGAPMAPDDVRRLLRQHATTVAVVTTMGERGPVGFTATSFTSVSLRPPLFSFCLHRGSSCWPAVAVAEHVGVHLLAAEQTDVARTFAERGVDRFAPTVWRCGPYGVPLVAGALAWLVGRVTARIAAGDHAIVLAEPLAAESTEGRPLLYHNGHYTALA